MDTELHCLLLTGDPGLATELTTLIAAQAEPRCVLRPCPGLGALAQALRERTPDVVLLDLALGADGPLAAYTRVHALAPALPVVLLATAESEVAALRAVRQGAADYLLREQLHATYLVRTLRYAVQRTRQERALTAALAREQQLRAEAEHERQRTAAILESITDAFFALDAEGRFTYVNRATERLFVPLLGAAGATLVGRAMREVIPEIEHTDFEAQCRRVLRERTPVQFMVHLTTLAGWFAVRAYPSEEGLSVYLRDITEQREAEHALSRARDYYHSLLDCLPALVWRCDAEGSCDYVNASWLEFTGRTLEEELGEGWMEAVHPEDRERCRATHRAAIATRTTFESEYRLRHHTGEYRWVLDIGRPMHDAGGAFQGLVGGAIDLHTQRQLEAKLRMAQKMEAIGRLAGGVAHDFNNLLTVITANVALLMEDLATADPARENVGEIRDAAVRAASLTHQLLAFSRQQVLHPCVLDLNEALLGTEKILRRLIPENIVLETIIEEGLPPTKADPGQVEQVILNLAINARDAIGQGGRIAFRTAGVNVSAHTRPQPYVRPGRYVALTVQDTGSGMDEATLRQIFEPFFTTKLLGEGTGLGLSTAYGIVKQSGGYIWAESEPGRGTTFTVLLPQEDAPATRSIGAAPAGAELRGEETVLLVEDEPLVRRAARRILERNGYTVLEAENGKRALAHARSGEHTIHLLLTDVVMPVLGGRELAEEVLRLHPDTCVLYTSGYTGGSLASRGALEPGIALLEKPFSAESLTRAVRAVLDGTAGEGARPLATLTSV
jgi:PAS domain S-box-containing protein